MTLQRRLRVAVVVGTRPEVVKMAPVVRELLAQSKTFDVSVCTTGQHQDLLEDMLQVFDINPDVQLVVDRIGQSLAGFTAATATSIEEFFIIALISCWSTAILLQLLRPQLQDSSWGFPSVTSKRA